MKLFAPLTALSALSVLGLPAAFADDWPQWRGPDRDAVSHEAGLLQQWPEEGPPLAWEATGLGRGMGGVAVSDGRVYTTGDDGDAAYLHALDEATGDRLWRAKIGRGGQVGAIFTPDGPRGTPTVDGDRVYILSQHGELVCFTTAGEEVWRTDLVADHGGLVPLWGYSESVLIDGDKLICTPGAKDGTLLALDKLTGESLWKSEVPVAAEDIQGRFSSGRGYDSGARYASPIAIDFGGVRQYVQLTAKSLAGFSAADGSLLWQYDPVAAHISCATPLYHDGLVVASSAYEGGCGAVRLKKTVDGSVAAEEVYFTRDLRNHHGGLVALGDTLYGAAGGNEGGFLVALDFQTGELLWRERDAPKGSVLAADGRLYLRTEDGEALLIEPSREGYLERGRFTQPGRSDRPAWAHPAVANGKLYLRDQDRLLCYDVAAK